MIRSSVGRLILGTAGLGQPYGLSNHTETPEQPPGPTEVAELLALACERGVRRVDTAPAYGQAEERLGRALPVDVGVWTKLEVGLPQGHALTKAACASLDRSCKRLGRQRIEVLQWHNWHAGLRDDPAFRACWQALAKDQRVGRLGASTYGPNDAEAAVRSGLFAVVQIEWSILNQGVLRRVAGLAKELGVELAARSVLLQGVLTDRALPPFLSELQPAKDRIRSLAATRSLDLAAFAVRAALDQPSLSWVVVGLSREDELLTTLAAAEAPPLGLGEDLGRLDASDDPLCDPRRWATLKA